MPVALNDLDGAFQDLPDPPVERHTAPVAQVYHDPAGLGFPPSLPIELAIRSRPVREVCESFGIDRAEFERLCGDPVFMRAVAEAAEAVKTDGFTFRMKAQLQSEELLKKSWEMIHDVMTPPAVKADLLKQTVKWAGYEPKNAQEGTNQNNLQININLA